MRGIYSKVYLWWRTRKRTVPRFADTYREHMGGIDLLDNSEVDEMAEDEGLDAFLAQVRDLDKNPAFEKIRRTLERNQLQFTALEAENIDQVNFGRATVNGLRLFREEVDRLVGEYRRRHTTEGDFNSSELV